MKIQKFKTNIKSTGCLATASPALNEALGEDAWKVDVNNLQKTLTVTGDVNENEVIVAVKEAGFIAEPIA